MRQAQRGVSGNRALAIQNRRDTIRRDFEPARELRGAHGERVKFLSQVFSGVNSPRCHGVFLSDNRQSRRSSGQVIHPATQNRCATDR